LLSYRLNVLVSLIQREKKRREEEEKPGSAILTSRISLPFFVGRDAQLAGKRREGGKKERRGGERGRGKKEG